MSAASEPNPAPNSVVSLIMAATGVSAATLHEAAGKIGALPAAIRPVQPGMRVVGPALPARGRTGDNLWLHRAIYAANPGEVLVVDVGGGADANEFGHWGEVMAAAAQQRGIAGLVINGGVRDGEQLKNRRFPTFAQSLCIGGTAKDPHGSGAIGSPVRLGRVTINRGDLVVGDTDGVVVIPAGRAQQALLDARGREDAEQQIFERLAAGERSLDIYSLPTEQPDENSAEEA